MNSLKTTILFTALLPLTYLVQGQSFNYDEEQLYGLVKLIKQYGYETNKLGSNSIKLKIHSLIHFDSSGHLLSKSTYSTNKTKRTEISYRYENNKIVEISKKTLGGAVISKTQFKTSPDGTRIEKNIYDQNSELASKTIYSYDTKTKISVEKQYDGIGTILYTDSLFYDADNRDTLRVSISSSGDHIYFKSQFCKQGFLTLRDRLSENGFLESRTRYVYKKTDKHGNWLKKDIYSNDKKISSLKRKISYFKTHK